MNLCKCVLSYNETPKREKRTAENKSRMTLTCFMTERTELFVINRKNVMVKMSAFFKLQTRSVSFPCLQTTLNLNPGNGHLIKDHKEVAKIQTAFPYKFQLCVKEVKLLGKQSEDDKIITTYISSDS